jgi:cold shock CspA family protein
MIGQVKWFNNKAGYGFITVSDGEYVGKDIFAHYSTIRVGDTQYRYLVQGEYVEFQLSISTNTAHEFQATHISGIKGGLLMCETRQAVRPKHDVSTSATATASTSEKPVVNNNNTDRLSNRIFSSTPRRPATDRRSTPVSKSVAVDSEGFKVVSKKKHL